MANIVQLDDGTTRLLHNTDLVPDFIIGGPAVPDNGKNVRIISDSVIKCALAASDAAAGVVSWKNTLPYPVFVTGVMLDVTTQSSAACTVGIGTASTSISATNLLASQSVAAAGVFGIRTVFSKVAVGSFVTISKVSGATAGLVGSAYIEYFPAA